VEVAPPVVLKGDRLAVDQGAIGIEAANRLGDPLKAIREVGAAAPEKDALALLAGEDAESVVLLPCLLSTLILLLILSVHWLQGPAQSPECRSLAATVYAARSSYPLTSRNLGDSHRHIPMMISLLVEGTMNVLKHHGILAGDWGAQGRT